MNNNPYETRPHLACNGKEKGRLMFDHVETKKFLVNKRAVKRFGAKPEYKEISQDIYVCDKCGEFAVVIVCPSWKDYVLSGRIRVAKWLYRQIRDDDIKMKQRQRQ
jgi:hypothetical protein